MSERKSAEQPWKIKVEKCAFLMEPGRAGTAWLHAVEIDGSYCTISDTERWDENQSVPPPSPQIVHLVAACPLMLEVCKAVIAGKSAGSVRAMARHAIANANGGSK